MTWFLTSRVFSGAESGMNTKIYGMRWVLVLLGALAPVAARATEANYQAYQIGGRAAGMGGAATAVGLGPDAPYYNPAGLARSERDSVSLSANLYGWQLLKESDALFPGEEFSSSSFQSIPSSASGTYRLNDAWVFAFSVVVPQKSSFFETAIFEENRHYYSFSQDDQSLWIGPSAGVKVSERLSLGASAFVAYRSANRITTLFYGDQNVGYSQTFKMRNYSLLATLGLQYELDNAWRLGLSLQSPAINITGSGQWVENVILGSSKDDQESSLYADDLDAYQISPAQIRLGVGREKPALWAWDTDLTYHLPTSGDILSGTDNDGQTVTWDARREGVVDFNLGAEYYLAKAYPLRAGLFTSFSSAPEPDVENVDTAKIDLYGATLTIGRETANTAVNIGINYLYGTGDGFGWTFDDSGDTMQIIVDATEQHIYAVFNTAYFF